MAVAPVLVGTGRVDLRVAVGVEFLYHNHDKEQRIPCTTSTFGATDRITPLVPMTIDRRERGPTDVGNLIFRRHLTGSSIGGIAETREMLDSRAEHNIVSDIELMPIQKINGAYERILVSDVKYRFVIDMASLTN